MARIERTMNPCERAFERDDGRVLPRGLGLELGAGRADRLLREEEERDAFRAGARPPERRAGADDREEPLAERARDVRGEADVRDAIAGRLAGKHLYPR